MSWFDRYWPWCIAAQIGMREHRAAEPWPINLTTRWPRALLQCLFFTTLGKVLGGEDGKAYMFVGSIAIVISLFTLAQVTNTPMHDRRFATLYRLRSSRMSLVVVYFLRVFPLAVEAILLSAICIVAIGFITGQGALAMHLLALLPMYVVMVVTSMAAGVALAALGLVGRGRNDTMVANISIYVIIAASGATIPPGRIAWLDAIGRVCPMRHGLQAIHENLAGRAWLDELMMEIAVGIVWTAVAASLYAFLTYRFRRTDYDKVS